jgi:adenylate cyclase
VASLSEHVEPEWAMATIAFVDIRGFTTYADSVSAHQAVDYLNRFFGLLIPIVTAHGGHANKLLGDGFLAVFGAPERSPDHADRALLAAYGMIGAAQGGGYRIGIGINSGLVLVGTLGGGELHELGVVGDPVNVAARVQDATRELDEPLLLTEATRALLDGPPATLEPRGELSLRGKPKPVAVYAPARVRA